MQNVFIIECLGCFFMPKHEAIATYISILAIIMSVGTAIYTSSEQRNIASSDFKATELIMSDTVKLLSTIEKSNV